jgi:ATP-binding cassette subfamily B protein
MSFRLYNYFVEIKMIPALRAKIANDALELLVDKSQNFYQNNF